MPRHTRQWGTSEHELYDKDLCEDDEDDNDDENEDDNDEDAKASPHSSVGHVRI